MTQVSLARAQREQAGDLRAKHRLDGAPFGRVIGRGPRAVRVEVPDLGFGCAGVLKCSSNCSCDAATARLRRGFVVRVARQPVASKLPVGRGVA